MKSTVLTILTAVGASLCCTGPVLFTSIGATSLAGFTILEPLRPYLSLVAIGLLGVAFWRSYRPATAEACCSIEDKSRLRGQRSALWLTSTVVAAFLAFPYVSGNTVFASGGVPQDQITSDQQLTRWKIEGMTCEGCALGLEASLNRESGMEYCKVRYDDGEMDCRIDGVKLKGTDVPGLLTQYGYETKQIINGPHRSA